MLQAVFLDSGPLGLVTQRPGRSQEADACRIWMETLANKGIRIYLPEVTDFEVRRELLRIGNIAGVSRLDRLKTAVRYLPISTVAMLRAAEIWADARNRGVPSADARALDADVVLAAQAVTSGISPSEIVVATVNVRHIANYVAADVWRNIAP